MTSIRRHPRLDYWARKENIQRGRGGKPPLPQDNFGGLWRGRGAPPLRKYRTGSRRPKNTLLQMRGPGGAQGASFWADSQGNTSALDAQTAGRVRQEFASGGRGPTISGLMSGGRTGGGGFGQSPPSTSYMGGGMPGMGGGMRGGFGGGFGGRRGGFGGGPPQSNAFSNYSRSLRNRRTF